MQISCLAQARAVREKKKPRAWSAKCVNAQPGLMRHKEMPAPTRAQNKTHPTKVRCAVYIQAQPGGAGDRGRTGTVSLPSDFESDTSANSITPAHNIMIIAYFFHFVKQTASKFCIYSFVYFQHKTYLTTLDFWRIL